MNYPALKAAALFCIQQGVDVPPDLLKQFESLGIKSQDYYRAQLTRLVKSFYHGNMDQLEFVMIFGDMITGQLTKAWMEGMEANGLTEADMTDEWQNILDNIIASEKDEVIGFADEIQAATQLTGQPIEPFLTRVDLWAGRYPDVANQAKLITAEPTDKFEWVYGDTDHCSTCERLNGIVARAGEWEEAGIHPQMPPNPVLECGGWRCQCSLVSTDRRRTANVLTLLLEIATSAGI